MTNFKKRRECSTLYNLYALELTRAINFLPDITNNKETLSKHL